MIFTNRKFWASLFFLGGFGLAYFNWFINLFNPSFFFLLVGIILWVLGIFRFIDDDEGEEVKQLKKAAFVLALSVITFIGVVYTTKLYFLSSNFSFSKAFIFNKSGPSLRGRGSSMGTYIQYKTIEELSIKKPIMTFTYDVGDFLLVKYSNYWPEIYEVVAMLPDSLIYIEGTDSLNKILLPNQYP